MTALAPRGWLAQVLHWMPAAWLAALDAWSYRVAQRQMEKRRQAARPPAPIDYKVKPWRD